MADDETKRFVKRFEAAKKRRQPLDSTIDECYEYAIPLRDRPFGSQGGAPDLERLFDSTAPGAAQDLASEMLDDVWPTDAQPFELRAGPDVPAGQREEADRRLAEVAADITETINNSNFRHAAHQALLDWEIGTGVLLPEEGDYQEPVRFRHLPLVDAITDTGPWEQIDALFRQRKVKAGQVQYVWPKAKLSDELAKKAKEQPETEIAFIEGVERDWAVKGTETWKWRVVTAKDKNELIASGTVSGAGSKPFVDFSYMRVANEPIGRGPLQLALPDIKTLNLLKQYVLEEGDLAIGGMWTLEDDGVINAETVRIEPRTIIPRAPNSKGLERIDTGANFQAADFLLRDLQASIRAIMFGDDLGPPEGTPMSATEVLQRTSNRARRRAGPYTRLIMELLFQTVRRVAYIRVKQGMIKLPPIDGRAIVLRPLSPLTRAQAQDEILRNDRFLEMMNVRFGPQTTNLLINSQKYGDWLARKMGVDPNVLNSRIDREKMLKAIAALAAQAQAGEAAA